MHGVFAEAGNGALRLAADWDALYAGDPDPWGQSGEDDRLGPYYRESRARLVRSLRRHCGGGIFRGLEVGSGHGHVVDRLACDFQHASWAGLEISSVAIARAREAYPRRVFHHGDIADAAPRNGLPNGLALLMGRPYGVVVLGHVWWYVLERLDVTLTNALALLDEGGVLIVSQAFLAGEQRYARQIADGFVGALKLLTSRYAGRLRLIEAEYEASGRYVHNDGLMVFRKC